MCRFTQRYRLEVETDNKGQTWYKPQVRVNYIHWHSVVRSGLTDTGVPKLSADTSQSYREREKAFQLLNEWKEKNLNIKKPMVEYEYVS